MTVSAEPVAALRDELARRLGAGDRFAGLHATENGDELCLTALVARAGDIDPVDARLPAGQASYSTLAGLTRSISWYERVIHDLYGIVPAGHPRLDPLIRAPDEAALPVHVHGPGLFTIPHGPVRSGVFESVEYVIETAGENIPHVDVRVHAKHRGVARRFEGMRPGGPAGAVLLAERVEGIASVAHALAYCHAAERLGGVRAPAAARGVRVIHAELERVANHLDVAMKLALTAGQAVAEARFAWHKERTMRLVSACCGSRFGRGVVVPGGVAELPRLSPGELITRLDELERGIAGDEHELMGTSSFLDRIRTTGPLPVALARAYGLLGPIGRASGCHDDDRGARPYDGYDALGFTPARGQDAGDAQERLRIRFTELHTAFELARAAARSVAGRDAAPLAATLELPDGRAVGWAEAPQGEVVYVLEVAGGAVRHCWPRSASFHNLMAFPEAFVGDVFTDFPFTEASFGLSIAGVAC
jgi:Ni,Fe-hydrogenase III large subunit